MDIKKALQPRFLSITIFVVIAATINVLAKVLSQGPGMAKVIRLPFIIKHNGCVEIPGGACNYSWSFSGIVVSLLFWIALYVIISILTHKRK